MDIEALVLFTRSIVSITEEEVPNLLKNLISTLIGRGRCSEEILKMIDSCIDLLAADGYSGAKLVMECGNTLVRSLLKAASDNVTFTRFHCCYKKKSMRSIRKTKKNLIDLLDKQVNSLDGKDSVIYLIEIATKYVEDNINTTGDIKKAIVLGAIEERIRKSPNREELTSFLNSVGTGFIDSYVALGKANL